MKHLSKDCPYCDGTLEIERLRCQHCKVAIEKNIPIPRLARLDEEKREFIELFIRCSGSLKEVASRLGISYPTVRSRLDNVIHSLEEEEQRETGVRRKILDDVESGRITVDEAMEKLGEL